MNNKEFVRALSDVIAVSISNVEKVEYELWGKDFNGYEAENEFIVITYKGGAIAVRNVNMNSLSATFREIGKLLDGGYYDEVDYYNSLPANG